jgi:phosphotransferase system  glucose/maltose/N-acetylglucosamine-specific IIC component
MSLKMSLREIIAAILNEIKAALKDYANEAEVALKQRLKKLLIISIVSSILMALGISLAGSASLFILIGSLRYLELSMPAWLAWLLMGTTSAIAAAVLFIALFLVLRKQLKTTKTPTEAPGTQKETSKPAQNN